MFPGLCVADDGEGSTVAEDYCHWEDLSFPRPFRECGGTLTICSTGEELQDRSPCAIARKLRVCTSPREVILANRSHLAKCTPAYRADNFVPIRLIQGVRFREQLHVLV